MRILVYFFRRSGQLRIHFGHRARRWRIQIGNSLHRLHRAESLAGGDLSAHLGQLYENDVAQRLLGIIRDADGRILTLGFDPFVFFGVFPIAGISHSSSLDFLSRLLCARSCAKELQCVHKFFKVLCTFVSSVVNVLLSSGVYRTASAPPAPSLLARGSRLSKLPPIPQVPAARRPGQYSFLKMGRTSRWSRSRSRGHLRREPYSHRGQCRAPPFPAPPTCA